MLNLVNHRCSFLSIFALLFLITSCSDEQTPITGVSEWDLPYIAKSDGLGYGRADNYVTPIDFKGDGNFRTVLVNLRSMYPPYHSELVFREGLLYREGKFENHFIYADQKITDLEAIDINNDGIKEVIICYVEDTSFKIRILKAFSYEIIDTFTIYTGYDFNKKEGWDSKPEICGFVDCDLDGFTDLLLKVNANRDRFPHILLAFSPKTGKVLWRKFFSSHIHKQEIKIVDFDNDGKLEIVGVARTAMNPTMLKARGNKYIYFVKKQTTNVCFSGVFDSKGKLLKYYQGKEAEAYYENIKGDDVKEYSGSNSYIFALDLNGQEIWYRQAGRTGDTAIFVMLHDNDKDTKIVLYCYNYAKDEKVPVVLSVLEGITGKQLFPEINISGGGSCVYVYEDNGEDRIVLSPEDGKIVIFDEKLEIIREIIDVKLKRFTHMFDLDKDGSPEFVLFDEENNSYIVDKDFKPLFKLEGRVEKIYDYAVSSALNKVYLPLLHGGNYSVLTITPQVKNARYYFMRYRWHFVGVLFLFLGATIAYTLSYKKSSKDVEVFGNMLSEFEVGLCLIHKRDKKLFFNRYIGNILNVPSNRFISLRSIDRDRENDFINVLLRQKKNAADSAIIKFEHNITLKDGKHNFVSGLLQPKAGSLMKDYLTVICFDRTEFIKGRWALVWGQVAQQMMHKKMKAPKMRMDRYLSIIERSTTEIESVNKLKNEINDIMALASDLLKGSQLDQPTLEVFDIKEIIEKIRADNEDLTLDGDIEISLRMPDEPVMIKGLQSRLFDALENIMTNAIKALHGEGKIELACELAQDLHVDDGRKWVNICVSDNGCGIEEADIDRIFDRNYTKFDGGSGFGLTFSKQVIESHGGKIEIESKINKYTIVTIRIPVYDGET